MHTKRDRIITASVLAMMLFCSGVISIRQWMQKRVGAIIPYSFIRDKVTKVNHNNLIEIRYRGMYGNGPKHIVSHKKYCDDGCCVPGPYLMITDRELALRFLDGLKNAEGSENSNGIGMDYVTVIYKDPVQGVRVVTIHCGGNRLGDRFKSAWDDLRNHVNTKAIFCEEKC